jgi:hypothetical protein
MYLFCTSPIKLPGDHVRLSIVRATLLLAGFLTAAPIWAQSADRGPVPAWTQQLTDLEARVRILRADDRASLDRTATALHDLDMQVSSWLADRGLTLEPPAVLDAFDDATYATMKKPSSFTSIYNDHTDGASVEYGATPSAHQTVRVAGHVKDDIHQEHNVGEPIRHFNNRTLSAGVEDTIQLSSVWRVRPIRHVEGSVGYSYLHRANEPGTTAPLLNTPNHKLFGYVVYSDQLYAGYPEPGRIVSVNLRYRF